MMMLNHNATHCLHSVFSSFVGCSRALLLILNEILWWNLKDKTNENGSALLDLGVRRLKLSLAPLRYFWKIWSPPQHGDVGLRSCFISSMVLLLDWLPFVNNWVCPPLITKHQLHSRLWSYFSLSCYAPALQFSSSHVLLRHRIHHQDPGLEQLVSELDVSLWQIPQLIHNKLC